MNRREFFKASGLGVAALAAPSWLRAAAESPPAGPAGQQPNFIVIFCDDLGYGDLGCYGAKEIRTPNIDRMAKEGLRFRSFYVAAPVCSASRAALLTGMTPQRAGVNGVLRPDAEKGLSTRLPTISSVLIRQRDIGSRKRPGVVDKSFQPWGLEGEQTWTSVRLRGWVEG